MARKQTTPPPKSGTLTKQWDKINKYATDERQPIITNVDIMKHPDIPKAEAHIDFTALAKMTAIQWIKRLKELNPADLEYLKTAIDQDTDIRRNELLDKLTLEPIFGKYDLLEAYLVIHDLDRNFAKIGNTAVIFAESKDSAIKQFRTDNRITQKTANITAHKIKDLKTNYYYYQLEEK